jgi:hypothetical protein
MYAELTSGQCREVSVAVAELASAVPETRSVSRAAL